MCICCVNHLVPGWSMCCRWRNCTRRILWVKSLEKDETGPTHKEHKGKRMMSYKAIINGSTYIPYLMLGSLVYSALDWRASSWSLFLSSIRCRFATDPSKGWGVVILGKQRCQNIRVPSATSYPLVNTGDSWATDCALTTSGQVHHGYISPPVTQASIACQHNSVLLIATLCLSLANKFWNWFIL